MVRARVLLACGTVGVLMLITAGVAVGGSGESGGAGGAGGGGGERLPLPIGTTINDFFLPGTQPFLSNPAQGACCVDADCSVVNQATCLTNGGTWLGSGSSCNPNPCPTSFVSAAAIDRAEGDCSGCHSGNAASRPQNRWRGSMMGQAARDPIFYACLDIANADAALSGDLCIRCHSPVAWVNHRSVNPGTGKADGLNFVAADFEGVTCCVCHRMATPLRADNQAVGGVPYQVDTPDGPMGIDDLIQKALVDAGHGPPGTVQRVHSGSYVLDELDRRRGPRDLPNSHEGNHPDLTLMSPFHREGIMCGTCHDVSNPAYKKAGGAYVLGALDQQHETLDKHDMFPIERTFSEWQTSEFARREIDMGGRFDTRSPKVSTCQDCHMPQINGTSCTGGDPRQDIGQHNFNGVNSWVLKVIGSLDYNNDGTPDFPESETRLSNPIITDALKRTVIILQEASDMLLSVQGDKLNVRIINNSGHRLPTGYPEGRRMWINVQFYDVDDQLVQEYGEYDFVNGNLVEGYPDFEYDTKVYEAQLGVTDDVANAAGITVHHAPGTNITHSFHFVLNNAYIKDTRIPPRGFSHAAAGQVQAAPVDYAYADGQYWDDTQFQIPTPMGPPLSHAVVRLYSQTTTREYIEFLRDSNPNPPGGGRGVAPNRGEVAYNAWASAAGDKSRPVVMDHECMTLGNPFPTTAIHVKADASGAPINGQNWNQAYRTLQDALAAANSGSEIWVAAGTYKPTAGADRAATHQLKDGVRIYGGFAGLNDAEDLASRTMFDQTILSGEIGVAGDADNSYHVVTASCLSSSAVLDGFTIRDGNANGTGQHASGGGMVIKPCTVPRNASCANPEGGLGGSPAITTGPNIANCTFIDNKAEFGGAIDLGAGTGMIVITDSRFLGNTAAHSGGAIDNNMEGNVAFSNCLFRGNSCTAFVGGAINNRGVIGLINCTVASNSSANLVGGMFNSSSAAATITNCIFWDNSDQNGMFESAQLRAPGNLVALNHSCVQNITNNLRNLGAGNVGDDPKFLEADVLLGNLGTTLRLTRCSPVTDAGHSLSVPAQLTKDLADLDRIVDNFAVADTGAGGPPVVDMGAFEFDAGGCLADIAPEGGDDEVSITDVVFVVSSFGELGGPADVNCDGMVSVHDVVVVMSAYGGCF